MKRRNRPRSTRAPPVDADRRELRIDSIGAGGARAQVMTLAQSDVPVAFGVSCDPAAFARDARI